MTCEECGTLQTKTYIMTIANYSDNLSNKYIIKTTFLLIITLLTRKCP